MIRRILPAVLGGGLLLVGSLCAQENPENPKTPPVTAPAPSVADHGCWGSIPAKDVRTTVIERSRAVAKPEVQVREIVTRQLVPSLQVDYKDVKQTVVVTEFKPRVVTRENIVQVTKECEEVDPCTGKVCKVLKCVPEVQKYTVTMYDRVEVEKVVVVRVPVTSEVLRPVDVLTLTLEDVTVPAIETRLELNIKDNTVLGQVPPPPPPPPCAVEAPCEIAPCPAKKKFGHK